MYSSNIFLEHDAIRGFDCIMNQNLEIVSKHKSIDKFVVSEANENSQTPCRRQKAFNSKEYLVHQMFGKSGDP